MDSTIVVLKYLDIPVVVVNQSVGVKPFTVVTTINISINRLSRLLSTNRLEIEHLTKEHFANSNSAAEKGVNLNEASCHGRGAIWDTCGH